MSGKVKGRKHESLAHHGLIKFIVYGALHRSEDPIP